MTERTGKPASDQELAALVDGTLSAERRREIENQLANSEQIRESIHRQRAAIELTREVEVPASDALHMRVAEMASARAPKKRSRLEIGGLVTAVGAVAIALVLVLTTGSNSPTIDQVVATASAGATAPAPKESATDSKMLNVSVGDVQFPTWENEGGWWATGARTDQINGRHVETVFYKNDDNATMKYSVVDGKPIDTLSSGAHYELTGSGDTRRIVWRAGGHTCIIEAQGVDSDQLERLVY